MPCRLHESNRTRSKRRRQLSLLLVVAAFLSYPAAAQEESPLPPGKYRLEMIMASTTRVPFFGSSQSASRSISLVEVRRGESGFMQNHQVCDFRVLDDSKMIKLIFPEKFIAALAKHSYPIELVKDAQGWNYRADLGVERIGYRADGGEDKLPTKIDDPAVFDWDGDGHPGATLQLSIPLLPTGELYVVQRGQSVRTGRIVERGKIEGAIEVRNFDQKVLGARPGFLAKSPEIKPNPEETRFTLNAVPDDSTCETFRAARGKP